MLVVQKISLIVSPSLVVIRDVIKVNSQRKYNVVNYDNNHRLAYGAFMENEVSREKLLSGRIILWNENYSSFVVFASFF